MVSIDHARGVVVLRGDRGEIHEKPLTESALTRKRRERTGYDPNPHNSLFWKRFRVAEPVFYGDPDEWARRPSVIPWAKLKVGQVFWYPVNPGENYWQQWCRWYAVRDERQRALRPKKFKLYHGKIFFAVLRIA